VSAVLTLTGSKIRHRPTLDPADLEDEPLRRTVSVATSTAQNDAGVFEFHFRDERYMPFEGAGCVSSWRLELPRAFRQFDYQTITDVILHVSYTAERDGVLAEEVQSSSTTLEGTILDWLSENPLERAFSLRQDFAGGLNRLIHSASSTSVPIGIDERFLPIFIRGRSVRLDAARLVLRTAPGQTVSGVELELNGQSVSGFTRLAADTDLFESDILGPLAAGLLGDHTLAVADPGDLAPDVALPGDPSAIDDGKLLDVRYVLA
jgi:hypothetical protein